MEEPQTSIEPQAGDENTAWIQGDWAWLQCGASCHDGLYDAGGFVERALADVRDCAVSSDDIPTCPRCGARMVPWVRGPEFLERSMYREQYHKYSAFLEAHLNSRVLFLELGVRSMTPMFIKEPFWNFTYCWPGGASYVSITLGHAVAPREIREKSPLFDAKIDKVLHRAAELKRDCAFESQSEAFKTEKPINRADALGIGWKAAVRQGETP